MFAPGIRVVRGFDWIWGDQDSGIGGVGTVSEIGQPGSKRSPDKTVVVNWDNGTRSNYRVGYHGKYDLLILDNAQCGVRHPNSDCNECHQNGILGIRYKCSVCENYNLCSLCYHNDKHDLTHPFSRYDTAASYGVILPPRALDKRCPVRGIFSKAIVQRGHDWKWGMQDGGEGNTGIVTEICNWGDESCRSVACVTWQIGSRNDYRVGHKGIVDLQYVTPAVGGWYYFTHLPVLEKLVKSLEEPVEQPVSPVTFTPGDKVKVLLDLDKLKRMQQGHGGWNPRMTGYIGKVGIVHRITDKGDVRVQYEGCANRWTFHVAALSHALALGDLVRVRNLQRQNPQWVPVIDNITGKLAKITNVCPNGDIQIEIVEDDNHSIFTLNPMCVVPELKRKPSADLGRQGDSNEASLLKPCLSEADRSELSQLMNKVAQGSLDYVKEMYAKDPALLDTAFSGKTLLQVAAYHGHVEIVQFLLDTGRARVGAADHEGDTALHDAAFGNRPEILEMLLNHPEIDINSSNGSRCTALHIASHKCLPQCVSVLLRHKPDVNIQDTYGDTPLHDAINYQCTSTSIEAITSRVRAGEQSMDPLELDDSGRIIQMLTDYPGMNFTLCNKRGFNVLQHAALKGNAFACAAVCLRAPHMADVVKDDGFSALHLAALNGHRNAVHALVTVGRAGLNLKNNRSQPPLLLAVSQGHCEVIEYLVSAGCDARCADEDGNTVLHIAALKKDNTHDAAPPTRKECPRIHSIYEVLPAAEFGVYRLTCAIIIYFMKKGCDPDARNKDDKVFYDLMLPDNNFLEALKGKVFTVREKMSEDDVGDWEVLGALANVRVDARPGTDSEDEEAEMECCARPNSMRELAFSGPAAPAPALPLDNTNCSPFKINYNYNNYDGLGDSSSNNSPSHAAAAARAGAGAGRSKADEGALAPARPPRSRARQPQPHPQTHSSQCPQPELAEPVPASSRLKPAECVVCCELSEENCGFEPCGHRIACEDCAGRMKKCLACGTIVERRITVDGRVISCRSRQPSAERLRYLECKIAEIEETHCCSICMERRRCVAFMCGHSACAKCAQTLTTCHMCRQQITNKINLY